MPRDKHTSSTRAPGRAGRAGRSSAGAGRSAAGAGRPAGAGKSAGPGKPAHSGPAHSGPAHSGPAHGGKPASGFGKAGFRGGKSAKPADGKPAFKGRGGKAKTASRPERSARPADPRRGDAPRKADGLRREKPRREEDAAFTPEKHFHAAAQEYKRPVPVPQFVAAPQTEGASGPKSALVTGDEDGIRVDRWFSRYYPGLTHGMLEKMLRTGQIRVNGKRIRAKDRMMTDDVVRLPPQLLYGTLNEKPKKPAAPKMDGHMLQERVIYMDGSVIVINKPAGLATQGGSGLTEHVDGMLDDLMFEKKIRPRLVHRLDRDTSGVLVIARNASAAAILSKSLAERDASKVYWALTKGVPKPRSGVIKAALVKEGGHGPRGRDERMMVTDKDTDGAKAASTAYAVMGEAGEYAWVACKPLTGRTHQIRVHLASIGTPIVGDFKYGGTNARGHGEIEDRLHLHARMIDMAAPDQVRLHAVAELPDHMKKAWALFGFDPDSTEDPFGKVRKKK